MTEPKRMPKWSWNDFGEMWYATCPECGWHLEANKEDTKTSCHRCHREWYVPQEEEEIE